MNETSVFNWERNRVQPASRLVPSIIRFIGYCPYTPVLSFRENLRIRRQSLGFSQEKMAEAFGINESTLASWERGDNRPTRKSLGAIIAFFSSPHN